MIVGNCAHQVNTLCAGDVNFRCDSYVPVKPEFDPVPGCQIFQLRFIIVMAFVVPTVEFHGILENCSG